jgi:hypothetical protein
MHEKIRSIIEASPYMEKQADEKKPGAVSMKYP